MRAIVCPDYGPPEILTVEKQPDPTPGPGQFLVQHKAWGISYVDVLMCAGGYQLKPPVPFTPGLEACGDVIALGEGAEGFEVGDKVMTSGRPGLFAEMCALDPGQVHRLPSTFDYAEGAAYRSCYMTAWNALTHGGRLEAGEVLLVHGAAGGVGSAVVDLCRLEGVEVIAGAGSAAKCAFAAGLGAAHTIDYSRENVPDRVLELTGGRGVDLVLDQLVGPDFTDNLRMLVPLGMIVSFNALAGLPEKELFAEMRAHLGKSPAVRCFSWHSYDASPEARARVLGEVVERFARADGLAPAIHATLPLADARTAHEMLDNREILGKVVLKP